MAYLLTLQPLMAIGDLALKHYHKMTCNPCLKPDRTYHYDYDHIKTDNLHEVTCCIMLHEVNPKQYV